MDAPAGRDIKDEVGALPDHLLLQEGWLWLRIVMADRPDGWTDDVLRDQQISLEEIQNKVSGSNLSRSIALAAREQLVGYSIRMRRLYGGASAAVLFRQLKR